MITIDLPTFVLSSLITCISCLVCASLGLKAKFFRINWTPMFTIIRWITKLGRWLNYVIQIIQIREVQSILMHQAQTFNVTLCWLSCTSFLKLVITIIQKFHAMGMYFIFIWYLFSSDRVGFYFSWCLSIYKIFNYL